MASDRPTLKLCSWNVRGIHNPIKRKKILSFLKKEHVHIALLQETHLTPSEHLKFKRDWVGQVYSSSFTSKSRGVWPDSARWNDLRWLSISIWNRSVGEPLGGGENTGCWLDKPSAYVGDWRAKSTNQINEAYDVITERRGKLIK